MWSQTRHAHDDFRRAHVFGCPVYVLEPKLQDGKKIPKWNPRSRLGMFVGFSTVHSSLVPLVLNVRTGKISPQYHVIFDDKFETVSSLAPEEPLARQWNRLFKLDREFFLDVEYDSSGLIKTSLWPALSPDWMPTDDPALVDSVPIDPPARRSTSSPIDLTDDSLAPLPSSPVGTPLPPVVQPLPHSPNDNEDNDMPDSDNDDDMSRTSGGALDTTYGDDVEPAGDDAASGGAPVLRRSTRTRGSYRDGPAIARRLPIEGEGHATPALFDDPVPLVANRGSSYNYHPTQRIHKAFIADIPILQDSWDELNNYAFLSSSVLRDALDPALVDELDYRVLSAKTSKSKYNEDNPDWTTATQGPFQSEYWRAMETELHTLVEEMKSWTVVRRTPDMNVLPSTWAFKCKRRPDGQAKKFKARFCARGDRQIEGVDYFETYSPVAQWTSIRAMMILASKLNLVSAQCDITAAFLHAKVPAHEKIYVHQPRGFVRGGSNFVLSLDRFLYGLKQSPRYFYKYLSERMENQGLVPSQFDPCLFLSKDLIVLCYVDDLLLYAREDAIIDDFIERMQKDEEVILRKEGTAEGFLGVDIKRDGNKTTLTQSGLAKRVVEALGLCSKYSTPCATPAEQAPLPRDLSGQPASGTINYASVVGMLLYLCGHSRPDIAFAVHQCARYTFEPKRSHEAALKRIGRYLKGTLDKGLILDPTDDLSVDCYPDADFAGLWGHEDPQDPHSVRSRTGYIITLSGCPILWKSSMQNLVALSSMESEYVSLSTACRDLFPLIDLIKELGGCLDIPVKDETNLHVRIHEDNVGALTLGKLEPRRMTLRSKHYAVRYHWFRTEIGPRNIILQKIASAEQLGDIFTKGLGRVAFQRLRKQIMGW